MSWWVERGLWLATLIAVAVMVRALVMHPAPAPAPAVEQNVLRPFGPFRPLNGDSVTAWARTVVSRNPFRLNRSPSEAAFAALDETPQPVAEPPAWPVVQVRGVVGGPPWRAVLEGIPGREGAVVVQDGARFGDLVIRAVSRDSVVVAYADSVWALEVPRRRT